MDPHPVLNNPSLPSPGYNLQRPEQSHSQQQRSTNRCAQIALSSPSFNQQQARSFGCGKLDNIYLTPDFHIYGLAYAYKTNNCPNQKRGQMLFNPLLLSPVSMDGSENAENQMKHEDETELLYYNGGRGPYEEEAQFGSASQAQNSYYGRPLSSASSFDMYGSAHQDSLYSPAPTQGSFDDGSQFCRDQDLTSPHRLAIDPSTATVSSFSLLHYGLDSSDEDIAALRASQSQGNFDSYYAHDQASFDYMKERARSSTIHGQVMGSPPTPANSNGSASSKRNRSAVTRSASKNSAPSVPEINSILKSADSETKSRPPRKRKSPASNEVSISGEAKVAEKPHVPKLDRPLSELTAGYTHIPIRDMQEWVNRSLETRLQEVEKRKGYIARPMNSFMLYRSAYAERTKLWCTQNNHQVVSSVSGASWPLEPTHIKDLYNTLAKIERNNHQTAHPGYKFSPSKAQLIGKKRKDSKDEVDLMESGTNDDVGSSSSMPPNSLPFATLESSKQHSSKKKKTTHNLSESISVSRPSSSSMALAATLPQVNSINYHSSTIGALKSSYETTNPGKRAPSEYGSTNIGGSYYQTSVRPTTSAAARFSNIEDVTIRKTQGPLGKSPIMSNSLAGEDQWIIGTQPATSHLESAFDMDPVFGQHVHMMAPNFPMHNLPGYDNSMDGIIDNPEPWSLEQEEIEYDDWLNSA